MVTKVKSILAAWEQGQPNREYVIDQLVGLIALAKDKIEQRQTKSTDRMKWARILTQASRVLHYHLKARKLSELEERILLLEEKA